MAYDLYTGVSTTDPNNKASDSNSEFWELVERGAKSDVLFRSKVKGTTNNADVSFVADAPFTTAVMLYEDVALRGTRDYVGSFFYLDRAKAVVLAPCQCSAECQAINECEMLTHLPPPPPPPVPSQPPMPPRAPPPMTCSSTGDPHVHTFGGHDCDLVGPADIFTLVDLPGFHVQAFNCPAMNGNQAVGSNAGVAARLGSDIVSIVGQTVKVNGVTITAPAQLGDVNVAWTFGGYTAVATHTSGNILEATYDTSVGWWAPPGYWLNVLVSAIGQPLSGLPPSACSSTPGDYSLTCLQGSAVLFDSSDLAAMEAACGSRDGSCEAHCGDPPPHEAMCNNAGIAVESASASCEAACPCHSEASLSNCITDFCALGGDVSALDSCSTVTPCPCTCKRPPVYEQLVYDSGLSTNGNSIVLSSGTGGGATLTVQLSPLPPKDPSAPKDWLEGEPQMGTISNNRITLNDRGSKETAVSIVSSIPIDKFYLYNLDNFDRDAPKDAFAMSIPGKWVVTNGAALGSYDLDTGVPRGGHGALASDDGSAFWEFRERGAKSDVLFRNIVGGVTNNADVIFEADAPFTEAPVLGCGRYPPPHTHTGVWTR